MKVTPATTRKPNKHKKPVYGFGINDSDYQTHKTINGKQYVCPFYSKWISMLQRCYSSPYHNKYPTYIGCYVCEEWLIFSNFKAWMEVQGWQGKQLDKDIVKTGNRMYSPETCIFVASKINHLLNNRSSSRGDNPQGVCYHAKTDRFLASCNVDGKSKHVGCFKSPELASDAYIEFKSKRILSIATEQDEPLRGYLIRISNEFSKGTRG